MLLPKESYPVRFAQRARRFSLWACCFFMLAVVPSIAQTVRPVVDENVVKGPGKKASGRIEYVNDSLQSLNVVLDTKSFTVSDTGDLSYQPLDGSIHVRFSATSFQIPPKQNYYVFYEAWADALPSWFVVYATFSGFAEKTREGLKLNLLLPHTIYLLPQQGVKKDELVVKMAEYRPEDKKITVRVENTGPSFGRVLAEAISGKRKSESFGFPVFPHRERQIEIPWEASDDPARQLVLRLEHFQLEHAVGTKSP
jgi:hypothetical protein